jgi:conjugal transfer/type IV secretion protein DotA/TraY
MRVKNNYGRALLGLLAGLAMFAIAPVASAEISIPGLNFNPSAGDESLKMIGTFFGTDSGIIKGSSSVMGALMNIFNGAVLSLASIFAFYTIVSAVVQTAHDGEVLGKRYSSLWVPIRSAAGIAAIVPAGGFSAVQMLVLWVAAQGVGLSNQLWVAGVDSLANNGGFSNQVVASQAGKDVVKGLVPIAACLHANNMAISKLPADYENRPVEEVQVKPPIGGSYRRETVMKFGFQVPNANFVECGSVAYTADSQTGTFDDSGTSSGSLASRKVTAAVAAAQKQALTAAITSIRGSIAALGDGQSTDGSVLAQAAASFDNVVTAAAQSALTAAANEANSQYRAEVNKLKDKGWSAAGGSFMALSKLSFGVNAEMDTRYFTITPNNKAFGDDPTISANMQRLTSQALGKVSSSIDGGSDDASSIIADVIGKPFKSMTQSIADIPVTYGANPILYWKNVGDNILIFAGTVVVVSLGATYLAGAGKGLADNWVVNTLSLGTAKAITGGVEGVLKSIFLLVIFMTIGFVTIGVTLAVYLPMLPYIIWVSVLLSWMVAVAEAVIASPLWMMLHLNPEGDGIASGATEAGYKFVAAVFLRPALSVISFFVACAIMFAIGGFVNLSVKEAYEATRADNWPSLGSLFAYMGYLFVVAGLSISIVSKSFNLCLTIPETILRWIGSSMTGGESLTGEAKNEFSGAVGIVQNSGSQALTPGGRGYGKPSRSKPGGDAGTTPATENSTGDPKGGTPERPKAGTDASKE